MATDGLDWKNDVLPEINEDCLKCIKKVEKEHNKAMPGVCINHTNWLDAAPSQRVTCGEFSISEYYYGICRDRPGYPDIDVKTGYNWTTCANDAECAMNCVRKYVDLDRSTDCGRGRPPSRLCVDYGIMHAFGSKACADKQLQPHGVNVKQYARWMTTDCGVADPPISRKSTTTMAPPPIISIVVPIVVATILFVLVITGAIWHIKRRKRALKKKSIPMAEVAANNYGNDPSSSGFLNVYNIQKCTPEIQEMVKNKRMSIMNIDILEEIGRGQFGVIRKAYCYTNAEHTEKMVAAVKIIRSQQADRVEEDVNNFLREAYIMSQFDHLNVLNLIGVIWEQGELPAVVCPYMGKGSLLDLIKKADLVFSELDLLNFVTQISAGLEYLEALKFVHRDIALRNCLVSDLYVVKISDFGLTRDIYDSRIYECSDVTEKRLPWKWLAPESIKQGTFTHKSDVWAFGVTIWELYADGSSPYPAIGNLSVLQDCLQAGYRLSKPDKIPQQLYNLMRLMWSADPEDRPTFAELQSALKIQMANESSRSEYSYTMEPQRSPIDEYMRPLTRDLRDSKLYADREISHSRDSNISGDAEIMQEPEIY